MDAELNPLEMEIEFEAEFTLAEAIEMKRSYKEMGEKSLNPEFYQELTAKFNNSVHRSEKPKLKWEQVKCWFQDLRNRELQIEARSLRRKVKYSNSLFPTTTSMMLYRSAAESSSLVNCGEDKVNGAFSLAIQSYRKPKDVAAAELTDLLYEAKSARDFGWYDVSSFLNYRIMYTGELEVRVRFTGFDKDHDEWVNVRRGVRERSIPLEHSECEKVKVGDTVLCYRESEDHAIYCDARVVEIQRNIHDETDGCTCIFVVHFDYDFFEDQVRLNRICCRPTS